MHRMHHPFDPVFVDGSGRRRRTFRRFVLLLTVALACLCLFLTVSMLKPRTPPPPLPADTGQHEIPNS